MKQNIFYWAKQIAQTLLMIALISVAVDFWRKPTEPAHFANEPFTTLANNTLATLAQRSQEQTVLVYFWGSWCGVCKHTSPVVQQLHEDGVAVLGVALRSGSLNEVRDYLAQNQLTFDNINDENGKWSRQWQVKVTPSIVLIKNGKVMHSTTGLASYWGLRMRIAWANFI